VSHLPASPVGSVVVKRRPPGVAVPTNVSPSPKPEESGASLMKNSNVTDCGSGNKITPVTVVASHRL
jgi:hypothetical protein